MGLGKTAQSISVLAYQRQFCKIRGPFLSEPPPSLLRPPLLPQGRCGALSGAYLAFPTLLTHTCPPWLKEPASGSQRSSTGPLRRPLRAPRSFSRSHRAADHAGPLAARGGDLDRHELRGVRRHRPGPCSHPGGHALHCSLPAHASAYLAVRAPSLQRPPVLSAACSVNAEPRHRVRCAYLWGRALPASPAPGGACTAEVRPVVPS